MFIYRPSRWNLKKRSPGIVIQFRIKFFHCFVRKHYVIKSTFLTKLKNLHCKRCKYEVEKVAIWQHFLISGKHRACPFLLFVFCPQIKNDIITGLVSNFFNAPCKRVKSSLQKRKHHSILRCYSITLTLIRQGLLLVCFMLSWSSNK